MKNLREGDFGNYNILKSVPDNNIANINNSEDSTLGNQNNSINTEEPRRSDRIKAIKDHSHVSDSLAIVPKNNGNIPKRKRGRPRKHKQI